MSVHTVMSVLYTLGVRLKPPYPLVYSPVPRAFVFQERKTKNGFLYEYNPTYRNGPNEKGPSGTWETDVL